MPDKIQIVTDSSAQFINPSVIQRYDITIVPLGLQVDGHLYREGVDISSETFFRRMHESRTLPVLLPPSVETFGQVYASLCRKDARILSLHLSRAMHSTWQNAKAATELLLGRCEITVVDSQTVSFGLGLLVEQAARLAQELDSVDAIVRIVRKLIPRIYSIFNVETLEYVQRAGLLSESQAILGTMLGVRPFLTIEEGELIAMEKARSRFQAVDRMVEFVTEFAALNQLVILQNSPYPSEQTRLLQERLAVEVPDRAFPTMMYNPSLACFLGPDAMGIMIYEGDLGDDDKDFDEDSP